MKYIWTVIICLVLFGCNNPYKPGTTDIVITDKSSHVEPAGVSDTTDNTIKINMASPSAPDGPSKIIITKTPDGKTSIETFVSASYNVASAIAKVNLLQIPMYVGAALILLAVGIFLLLKDLKWSLIIGLVGAGMIVGTYLLAEYAIYFLLGLLVLLAYGVYFIVDYMRQRKANDETVRGVQLLKATGMVDKDKANTILEATQSPSTKKIVKKVKNG